MFSQCRNPAGLSRTTLAKERFEALDEFIGFRQLVARIAEEYSISGTGRA